MILWLSVYLIFLVLIVLFTLVAGRQSIKKFNNPDPSKIKINRNLSSNLARYQKCKDIQHLKNLHTELNIKKGSTYDTLSKTISSIYLPIIAIVISLLSFQADSIPLSEYFVVPILFTLCFAILAFIDTYFTEKNRILIETNLIIIDRRITELEQINASTIKQQNQSNQSSIHYTYKKKTKKRK